MLTCHTHTPVTKKGKGVIIYVAPEFLSHLQQPNSCLESCLDEACMPPQLDLQPNRQSNITPAIKISLTIQFIDDYFDIDFSHFDCICNTSY
jgi:hypothetical protein